MKKNDVNNKGFAMSELLAASIIILLLFSILFANYLPLVAEFENRLAYTNVTANYGAFYVRRIYKDVLEDDATKALLDQALGSASYYTVYNKSNSEDSLNLVPDELKTQLRNIINKYGIEEIIISKYNLSDLKSADGYKRSSGSLYKYINYLPRYDKGLGGKNQISEPYRILLKTSDFGYATTPILPDAYTPIECFTLKDIEEVGVDKYNFAIVDYDESCGTKVVVTPYEVNYKGKTGIITAIEYNADTNTNNHIGAFENKGIVSISLSKKVTSIGEKAFKDNKISSFKFEIHAPSVTRIGKGAFEGNELEKIEIPDKNLEIGEGAFANNSTLKSIKFVSENSGEISISDGMFAMSDSNSNSDSISLSIPANVVSIGKQAFKNVKLSSLEFAPLCGLETIGEEAFMSNSSLDSLDIPDGVNSIGVSAFENVNIGSLNLGSSVEEIGNSAFAMPQNSNAKPTSLTIPNTVINIGTNAFANQNISSLVFVEEGEATIKIGDGAFIGHSLNDATFPARVLSTGSSLGSNLFGGVFGETQGQIKVNHDDANKGDWCNALFGSESSCTSEINGNIKSYTYGNSTKYVSYIS